MNGFFKTEEPCDVISFETPNEDVEQAEYTPMPTLPVPVDVKGPVQTRELPAIAAGYSQVVVTSTAPTRILNADPKRKSVTLWSDTTNIALGVSQAQANASGAAIWLANVPLVITHTNEVWALASGGSTTNVNLFVEAWTL